MSYFYMLIHRRVIDETRSDIKYIGIFDDYVYVHDAINKLVKQPGFSSYPDVLTEDSFSDDSKQSGFMVKKFEVDKDYIDQTLAQDG